LISNVVSVDLYSQKAAPANFRCRCK